MALPRTKRKQFGRTVLFSPAANIEFIEQLTVQTEFAMQKMMHDWVDETKQKVVDAIDELDVIDTGATKAGVYGIYPIAQSKQRILRGSVEKQRQEVSVKTLEEYQHASYLAKQRRRSLDRATPSLIDSRTGRFKDPKSAGTSLLGIDGERIQRDVPINAIGTVTRKNLYSGVGVLTWYAIFPHDGLGQHEETGPREFFSIPVREQQEAFLRDLPRLESTVRGKLRFQK